MFECIPAMSADLASNISAFANSVSAIAVVAGLFIGMRQLNIWRHQFKQQRNAEVADRVHASAHAAVDIINAVRSPLASIPRDRVHDRTYDLERRSNRLMEGANIFQELRHAQRRSQILLQNVDVDRAIEVIFQVRIEYWNALDILVDYADVTTGELEPEERDLVSSARRTVYASYGERDDIYRQLNDALIKIETYLGQTMRAND
jgi:hypothetical protein